VAAIGTGAYIAAIFHLITHAFFKALLFLGSGSVIHGVEHGAHHVHAHAGHGNGNGHGNDHGHDAAHGEHGDDHHNGHAVPTLIPRPDGALNPDDPQDMRNMGGLLGRMPRTAITFIIGGLALSGFPFITAGFWSKDEILASAWYNGNTIVFWTLAVAAFLTAFYTMRQIGLSFLGTARTEMAAHAPESVAAMTIPLILITPFAIGLGWFGIPEWFGVPNWIADFLDPYAEYLGFHSVHPKFSWIPLLVSIFVAVGGLVVGYVVYGKGLQPGQIDPLRNLLGPFWLVLHNKYYIDELYNSTIVAFSRGLSHFLYWVDDLWVIDPIVNGIGRAGVWIAHFLAEFDRIVVDGLVNLMGYISDGAGRVLRNTQDGQIQVYLMVLAVSLTVWLLLKALPVFLTLV
jgi:NADH-quinone oxidoreductase subunit L